MTKIYRVPINDVNKQNKLTTPADWPDSQCCPHPSWWSVHQELECHSWDRMFPPRPTWWWATPEPGYQNEHPIFLFSNLSVAFQIVPCQREIRQLPQASTCASVRKSKRFPRTTVQGSVNKPLLSLYLLHCQQGSRLRPDAGRYVRLFDMKSPVVRMN